MYPGSDVVYSIFNVNESPVKISASRPENPPSRRPVGPILDRTCEGRIHDCRRHGRTHVPTTAANAAADKSIFIAIPFASGARTSTNSRRSFSGHRFPLGKSTPGT